MQAVCIMGPTASGKSALAFEIAAHLPCEIISVDSALVYRQMDIGTAKPSLAERGQVPHHLIDILDASESFSAADFVQQTQQLIATICQRQRVPLLVGGTMLYFRALQQGLAKLPATDETIRQELQEKLTQQGLAALYKQLQQVDTKSAQRINPNDTQRILRALEVYTISGRTMDDWWQQAVSQPRPDIEFLNIGLIPQQRHVLHGKIAQRFDQMLAQGFIDEVTQLFARPDLHLGLPAIRSVGYRQAWHYLQGDYDQEHMREKAIIATRQLAKRQLTWLRHWPDLQAFDPPDANVILTTIKQFMG